MPDFGAMKTLSFKSNACPKFKRTSSNLTRVFLVEGGLFWATNSTTAVFEVARVSGVVAWPYS